MTKARAIWHLIYCRQITWEKPHLHAYFLLVVPDCLFFMLTLATFHQNLILQYGRGFIYKKNEKMISCISVQPLHRFVLGRYKTSELKYKHKAHNLKITKPKGVEKWEYNHCTSTWGDRRTGRKCRRLKCFELLRLQLDAWQKLPHSSSNSTSKGKLST